MVKWLIGIPFSMTLNANLEWWGGAMSKKLSEAKFTIIITEWLFEQVHRDYPESLAKSGRRFRGRIGVDTRKWKPRLRECSAKESVFRIATVSRLHESKGHDILLRAIDKANQKLSKLDGSPQLLVTIIGDGPERAALELLAGELHLATIVNFMGSLGEESVIEELSSSDAFILASHSEPLGVVYMEAMALELPTVGTNAGGVPEIIKDAENGWLVPPKDPESLSNRILWLIEHPNERAV